MDFERVSSKRWGMLIAKAYETIGAEPMTIRELARKLKISKGQAYYLVKRLEEKGQVKSHDIMVGKYIHKIYYNPDFEDIVAPIIRRKEMIANKLFKIGKEISEIAEQSLYEVVKEYYPDAYRTPIESNKPDVISEKGEVAFEVTTAYENPIGLEFIRKKRENVNPDFDILFFAPVFSENIRERPKYIYIYKLPRSGRYPLFEQYKEYADVLREVGRKFQVISVDEYKSQIRGYIEQYMVSKR